MLIRAVKPDDKGPFSDWTPRLAVWMLRLNPSVWLCHLLLGFILPSVGDLAMQPYHEKFRPGRIIDQPPPPLMHAPASHNLHTNSGATAVRCRYHRGSGTRSHDDTSSTPHALMKSTSYANHIDAMSRLKRARRVYKVTKERGHRWKLTMNEDQRINFCKTSLAQIRTTLRDAPETWRSNVPLGLNIIETIDTTTFMQQPQRTTEQIWMVEGLQQLTHSDPRSSNVAEIASWCSRQWLTIHERDTENVAALTGIAQTWLSRAQPLLARIHRAENSSSSSGDSSQRSGAGGDGTPVSTSGAAAAAQQDEDSERRSGEPDYVEARGYLQPATEYLDRAVEAATAQRRVTGNLLTKAAEAHMSLGNTSSPRVNEPHFRRALQLLQRADALPEYTLPGYLQQYLDDYGRLID